MCLHILLPQKQMPQASRKEMIAKPKSLMSESKVSKKQAALLLV